MNRQCDCVVCVHFGQSEVSFDVLWVGQRGVRLFSGFPPFLLTDVVGHFSMDLVIITDHKKYTYL